MGIGPAFPDIQMALLGLDVESLVSP